MPSCAFADANPSAFASPGTIELRAPQNDDTILPGFRKFTSLSVDGFGFAPDRCQWIGAFDLADRKRLPV